MTDLKVTSWNVLHENNKFDSSFIAGFDADIICLQEMTDEFIEAIKADSYIAERYQIIVAAPVKSRRKGSEVEAYERPSLNLVTLVDKKYSVLSQEPSPVPNKEFDTNGITKFITGHKTERLPRPATDTLYVDINGRIAAIVNAHLSWANYAPRRIKELAKTLARIPKGMPHVIAGDLNTFCTPFINGRLPLAFENAQTTAAIRSTDDLKMLQRFCGRTSLTPTMSVTEGVTCINEKLSQKGVPYKFRNKLDHILVSAHFQVNTEETWIDMNQGGSDHRPIHTSMTLKPVLSTEREHNSRVSRSITLEQMTTA